MLNSGFHQIRCSTCKITSWPIPCRPYLDLFGTSRNSQGLPTTMFHSRTSLCLPTLVGCPYLVLQAKWCIFSNRGAPQYCYFPSHGASQLNMVFHTNFTDISRQLIPAGFCETQMESVNIRQLPYLNSARCWIEHDAFKHGWTLYLSVSKKYDA